MGELLLLVDGNNLLFRAFHGWAGHAPTPSAKASQTAIGFLALTMRPIREFQPTHLGIVFDAQGPSFRHEADETYKANRRRPEEGEDHPEHHLDAVRGHLNRLGIQTCAEEGVEADDVIASAATEASILGMHTIIYSSDRDFLQLVSDDIHVRPPDRSIPLYTPEKVHERFNVHPQQFIDFKALQGDPSDNIPGVPGIGPKTAALLLQQHETLDALFDRLWELSGKVAKNLQNHEERLRHNRAMIALRCDLPLPFSLDDCRVDASIARLNPFEAVRRSQ